MPPLPVFRQGKLLSEGFTRLGRHVAPAPLAINSVPYGGRAACINDGWCDAGCPILALANPFAVYIPRALQHGAQFQTETTVTAVLLGKSGAVRGVEYVNNQGTRGRVYAKQVVLAAAPVQTVRLLLHSAQSAAPHGVGNQSGLVGRNFSCHNVVGVYGMFDEETENHLGVSAGSLISQDGYRKNSHPGGAFGSYQWGIAPSLKPNDLLGIAVSRPELWGRSLQQFLVRASRNLASMSALCETLPTQTNRIETTTTADAFGVPLARIIRDPEPAGAKLAEAVTQEGLAILRSAGATDCWSGRIATSHPLGGTIMGRSIKDSVADDYGRVHGVPGLFIAGGALFPTAGGGSPTFTILALADRAAAVLLS